jgi:phosphate transporter
MKTMPPFSDAAKATMEDLVNRVTALYARCVTRGDSEAAQKTLRLHQREHVAWERDTVWRTMLSQTRGAGNTDEGVVEGTPRVVNPIEEKPLVSLRTPLGRIKVTKKVVSVIVALATLVILLNVQVVDGVEANRCLAILAFATILWATEVSGA